MMSQKQHFLYTVEKNNRLIRERQISFEEVISVLEAHHILDIIEHPNQTKYPKQKIYVLPIRDYVYFVPFEEIDEHTIHLKTIFANRKAKKLYMKGKQNDSEEKV